MSQKRRCGNCQNWAGEPRQGERRYLCTGITTQNVEGVPIIETDDADRRAAIFTPYYFFCTEHQQKTRERMDR